MNVYVCLLCCIEKYYMFVLRSQVLFFTLLLRERVPFFTLYLAISVERERRQVFCYLLIPTVPEKMCYKTRPSSLRTYEGWLTFKFFVQAKLPDDQVFEGNSILPHNICFQILYNEFNFHKYLYSFILLMVSRTLYIVT